MFQKHLFISFSSEERPLTVREISWSWGKRVQTIDKLRHFRLIRSQVFMPDFKINIKSNKSTHICSYWTWFIIALKICKNVTYKSIYKHSLKSTYFNLAIYNADIHTVFVCQGNWELWEYENKKSAIINSEWRFPGVISLNKSPLFLQWKRQITLTHNPQIPH